MSKVRKLSQRELSEKLGINESDVAKFVADNELKSDGSGYWVCFGLNTPPELLKKHRADGGYRGEVE